MSSSVSSLKSPSRTLEEHPSSTLFAILPSSHDQGSSRSQSRSRSHKSLTGTIASPPPSACVSRSPSTAALGSKTSHSNLMEDTKSFLDDIAVQAGRLERRHTRGTTVPVEGLVIETSTETIVHADEVYGDEDGDANSEDGGRGRGETWYVVERPTSISRRHNADPHAGEDDEGSRSTESSEDPDLLERGSVRLSTLKRPLSRSFGPSSPKSPSATSGWSEANV